MRKKIHNRLEKYLKAFAEGESDKSKILIQKLRLRNLERLKEAYENQIAEIKVPVISFGTLD